MRRSYRYTGEAEALLPTLHQLVQPGDVVESDGELNNSLLVEITGASAPVPAPATTERSEE